MLVAKKFSVILFIIIYLSSPSLRSAFVSHPDEHMLFYFPERFVLKISSHLSVLKRYSVILSEIYTRAPFVLCVALASAVHVEK